MPPVTSRLYFFINLFFFFFRLLSTFVAEQGFESLEVLALTNSVVYDWTFLRHLPNLKYLFIGGVEMHSLPNFLEHLASSFGHESAANLRLIEITFQPLVVSTMYVRIFWIFVWVYE